MVCFDIAKALVFGEFQELAQMAVLNGAKGAFIRQHHQTVLRGLHGHCGKIASAAVYGRVDLVLNPGKHFDAFIKIPDLNADETLAVAQLHLKCCVSFRLIILRLKPKLVAKGGQGDSQR